MAVKFLLLQSLLLGLAIAGRSCPGRQPHHASVIGSLLPTTVRTNNSSATPSTSSVLTTWATQISSAEQALASVHDSSILSMVTTTTAPASQTVTSTPSMITTSEIESTSLASKTTTSAAASSASETFIGLGTRYGDGCTEEDCWQNGACSFVDYDLPSGVDGSTCVSDEIFDNGANCGGCISVTYKGKTIIVMVTNATGGNATHLDMTPATWAKLTNGYSGGGVDGIEWQWVTCPIAETTPLWIRMHGGASQYWFAATVENARQRTAKLEVSSDQGSTWKEATLSGVNMYTLDGTLPNDTAWVRVTSITGDQVVVEDVALQSGVVTKATENYA